MGRTRKLVLASLLSLAMILSFVFAMGPSPAENEGGASTAEAAPAESGIAISVNGGSPVADAYVMEVGQEQAFTALSLLGGKAEGLLAAGDAQWSLATDDAGVLTTVPGEVTAWVTALKPGDAALYVTAEGGLVDVVELSFVKSAEEKAVTSVNWVQPKDGATLYFPAGMTNLPLTLMAQPNDVGGTALMEFTWDGGNGSAQDAKTPFTAVIPDVTAIAQTSATAMANVAKQYAVAAEATTNFTLEGVTADSNNDGIIDNPFSFVAAKAFGPNDLFLSAQAAEQYARKSYLTLLGGGGKSMHDVTDLVVQAEGAPDVTAYLEIPNALVPEGMTGVAIVQAAEDLETLVGADAAADLMAVAPAGGAVPGALFLQVSILFSDDGGETFSEVDPAMLEEYPIDLIMTGLNFGGQPIPNARLFDYPTIASDGQDGPGLLLLIDPAETGVWNPGQNGVKIAGDELTAKVGHLSVIGIFQTPDAMNITNIANVTDAGLGAAGYAVGGDEIEITVQNWDMADDADVYIDGQSASVDELTVDGSTAFITVTAPRAKTLDEPAASMAVDVRVEVAGTAKQAIDFDVAPDGFTYLGPDIDAVNPESGSEAGGQAIEVFGAGFESAQSAHLGGAPLVSITANETGTTFQAETTSHSQGRADLTVKTGNNYTGSLADAYSFLPQAPVVTSVTPDTVFIDGDYQVWVNGMFFVDPETQFKVNGQNNVYFTTGENPLDQDTAADDKVVAEYIDDMSLMAMSPVRGAAGDSGVYVETQIPADEKQLALDQTSENTLPFTFLDPANVDMSILDIDPDQGPLVGGTNVAITGENLPAGGSIDPISTEHVVRLGESLIAEQSGNQVTVELEYFRNQGADGDPAAMNFTLTYDPTVLELVSVNDPDPNIFDDWYNKDIVDVTDLGTPTPGEIGFTISGGVDVITTFDDQRTGGDPTDQTNPISVGAVVFDVVGSAGESTLLSWQEVSASPFNPGVDDPITLLGQSSFFTVGTEPTTPPAAEVLFGRYEADLTTAKQNGTETTINVLSPAGDRPGRVDVIVRDPLDPAMIAISRASKGYGFNYIAGDVVIEDVTPDIGWVFGGQVVAVQGVGFVPPTAEDDPAATEVYFDEMLAAYAPSSEYQHTAETLYVIPPPNAYMLGDGDMAEREVDVLVKNPGEATKQAYAGFDAVKRNAYTYARYDSRVESEPGASGDVVYTSFFFNAAAGTDGDREIVLEGDGGETDVDANASMSVPGELFDSAAEDIFVLARASKTSELFDTVPNIQYGVRIADIYDFDLHLFEGEYPWEEITTAFTTPLLKTDGTVVPRLNIPIGDTEIADLAGTIVGAGGLSLFAIDSTANLYAANGAYGMYEGVTYDDLTFNYGDGPGHYQSKVLVPEYNSDTTKASARIRTFSAYSLRIFAGGAGVPEPEIVRVLDSAGNEGPITDGEEGDVITLEGINLGHPVAVFFTDQDTVDLNNLKQLVSAEGELGDDAGDSEFSLNVIAPQAPAAADDEFLNIILVVNDGFDPTKQGTILRQIAVAPNAFQFQQQQRRGILLGLLAAILGLAAGDDGDGDGGPCFIATAAYGTPMAAEVDTLRALRDSYLLNNAVGSAFVDAYYRVSPAIADVVASNPVLAAAVRLVLTPVVWLAKLVLALPHVSALLALAGMVMVWRKRQKKAARA